MELGDLNGPLQPALFYDSMMLTFVQSQAAQSLQQGRAGTCSTLLESSVAGSAVLVWAGVDGSFCPACFVPWELPAHGGSTLQTDTRGVCRSLGHLGLPPCSHNHKDGLRCNVERPLTGEELLRSTGISIQLPQGSGTRLEHAAAVPASGKHAVRLPSLERNGPHWDTRVSGAFLNARSWQVQGGGHSYTSTRISFFFLPKDLTWQKASLPHLAALSLPGIAAAWRGEVSSASVAACRQCPLEPREEEALHSSPTGTACEPGSGHPAWDRARLPAAGTRSLTPTHLPLHCSFPFCGGLCSALFHSELKPGNKE